MLRGWRSYNKTGITVIPKLQNMGHMTRGPKSSNLRFGVLGAPKRVERRREVVERVRLSQHGQHEVDVEGPGLGVKGMRGIPGQYI